MRIFASAAAVRRAMLSKCSAALLVLLIVLPFTPPFSTCGLSDLIGEVAIDHGPMSTGKLVQDAAAAAAVTFSLTPLSVSVAVQVPVLTSARAPRESRPAPLRL